MPPLLPPPLVPFTQLVMFGFWRALRVHIGSVDTTSIVWSSWSNKKIMVRSLLIQLVDGEKNIWLLCLICRVNHNAIPNSNWSQGSQNLVYPLSPFLQPSFPIPHPPFPLNFYLLPSLPLLPTPDYPFLFSNLQCRLLNWFDCVEKGRGWWGWERMVGVGAGVCIVQSSQLSPLSWIHSIFHSRFRFSSVFSLFLFFFILFLVIRSGIICSALLMFNHRFFKNWKKLKKKEFSSLSFA